MNKWIEASRAGNESRIQAVVDDVREMVDKGYLSGNSAVYILASIGETEKAITIHLERARRGAYVDQGQLWLPAMRDLRLDPRFAEIAEAVNLVSYWRQVEWPDKCGPTDGENWACFN